MEDPRKSGSEIGCGGHRESRTEGHLSLNESLGQLERKKNHIYFHFKFVLVSCIALSIIAIPKTDSRLIHIYHKLSNIQHPNSIISSEQQEPQQSNALLIASATATPNAPNSSSSNVHARSFIAQALQGAQSSPENEIRPTIEFRSPMKRIMDLIGHHQPPVIVVSDSSGATDGTQQLDAVQPASTTSDDASTALAVAAGAGQKPAPQQVDQQQQQQQQHWTIVDTSQLGMIPTSSMAQQQLIQPNVPINMAMDNIAQQQQQQYFTFTPSGQLTPDSMMNQFAVVQANGGGAGTPFGFPQLIPSTAISPYQQQQQVTQSSQNRQQQASTDQQAAQPVFLSSYVPEVPIQPLNPYGLVGTDGASGVMQPTVGPSQAPPGAAQQQPNSIQSQIQAPKENDSKAEDTETDGPGDISGSESDKSSDEHTDDRRNGGGEQEGGGSGDDGVQDGDRQQQPGSGSMSYEDKYDSDANEHHQPSSRSTKFRAEPSGQVLNGLISVGLNDDCLQCICRAASGCDHLLRCITRGAEEKYCGPFQLTEEYWQKAGSPGDQANNFISFEDCANDADCAVETVTNYMKKYFRDCDGDDNITCMDYARLHRLKPNECDQTDALLNDHDAYWAKFQRCAEGYNRTRNGDDEDI